MIISDSVTTITANAFDGCTALTSITIPGSITYIGDDAFNGTFFEANGETELEPTATDLAGFTFNNVDGKWIKEADSSVPDEEPTVVSGMCGKNVTYEFNEVTGTLTISGSGPMFTMGLTSPWYQYRECITSVIIGDSITTIGDKAFDGCTSITSITIPSSITFIGDNAFEGTFYMADGETELEPTAANLAGYTFNNVDGKWIKEADSSVPDEEPTVVSGICGKDATFEFDATTGILTINGSGKMFSNGIAPWNYFKDAITSVVISDSITYIGENAFDGTFYEVNGETEIEPTAANLAGFTFNNVDGKWIKDASSIQPTIVSGQCGKNVTYEFNDVTGTLTISGSGPMFTMGLTSPWYQYRECITSVIIGDSITTIGDKAFDGCTSITSITIPSSITFIGDNAFEGTFYMADGETEIEPTAWNLAGSTFMNIGGKWIKIEN